MFLLIYLVVCSKAVGRKTSFKPEYIFFFISLLIYSLIISVFVVYVELYSACRRIYYSYVVMFMH